MYASSHRAVCARCEVRLPRAAARCFRCGGTEIVRSPVRRKRSGASSDFRKMQLDSARRQRSMERPDG